MHRRRIGRREGLVDAVVAAAMVAFGLFGTGPAGASQGIAVDTAAYPFVVAAALVLAVRRRWPMATLAATAVVTSAYLLLGYPYGPILVSFFVSVYTVAAYLPVRQAAVGCGVALPVLLAHLIPGPGFVGVVPVSAWVVVPFAVGATVGISREAVERDRRESARRRADAERLRIAQEVHDVVGHGLAAIHMQAEIALHLLDKRPENARTALAAISRSSSEALDELRVTLALVRRREQEDADRSPTPGLGQLAALRARLAEVGLPVTIEVYGEPRNRPAAVDLAAYRIVQEALTNVLRHAGEATATVRVGYDEASVTVEVVDNGRGTPLPVGNSETGLGLAGMRERVAALGGDLEVGPRTGGGFRVWARLPVPTPG
ncbi:MAG TPA: sensor histidine kinase [Micromonosporaceae bacterium]|nr:sensor histidine kinase [Micromonosporaceae bacterium]